MTIWLGGDEPHDPEIAARQDDWLRQWGDRASSRVLDLGCGHGRTMMTLAGLGHDVLGLDSDAGCLDACRRRADELGVTVRLQHLDFLSDWVVDEEPFDLICCLGNTFMLVDTDDAAVTLLGRCARHLAPGGLVVLDDLPGLFLPEVESGNWETGISEDGDLQLLWSDRDDVFTVRSGDGVDPDQWSMRPDDVPLRLWRPQSLDAVAVGAGLSAPETDEVGAVLVMRSGRAARGS